MGTIASVLQWKCEICDSIDPQKCKNCDTMRQILSNNANLVENSGPTNRVMVANADKNLPKSGEAGSRTTSRYFSEIEQSSEASSEDDIITKNEYKRVYKSMLRGCLRRPQRNNKNFPSNCVDCEDTRKYVKTSIELYHHFSTPSLNRRWICNDCESENSSVTWHCIICDTVSYLAPIYKEKILTREHSQYRQGKTTQQIAAESKKKKVPKSSNCLRRTQSLTTDKSFSCRSCHICFVNNCKDIFNLPDNFMLKCNKKANDIPVYILLVYWKNVIDKKCEKNGFVAFSKGFPITEK